jgi:parvulin-like peptidyl-prolyl isomerase
MKIIVNGEEIPAEMLQQELQTHQRQQPELSDEERQHAARDRAVEWMLIRQEARKRDLQIPAAEVDAEFDRLCESHGGKETFFQRFNLTGKDEFPVKKDLEQNLKTQRLLEDLSREVSTPKDEAVQAFFEAHRDLYTHPEQVHAAHIVKHPQNAEAAEKAFAELAEARQKIRVGADFLQVANEVSECNDTAPDLGTFPRGQMVPEFEWVVFSMEPGEVSPVFQSPFGLHIATVLEKVPARPMSLDECRDSIAEHLLHDRKNEAIGEWVDARKEEAEVLIEDDPKPETD